MAQCRETDGQANAFLRRWSVWRGTHGDAVSGPLAAPKPRHAAPAAQCAAWCEGANGLLLGETRALCAAQAPPARLLFRGHASASRQDRRTSAVRSVIYNAAW